jgi:hypothetical protein
MKTRSTVVYLLIWTAAILMAIWSRALGFTNEFIATALAVIAIHYTLPDFNDA